jgi:tartrate dehydrogenase/decarboxylase/D-malate dehydrogenase
MSSKDTHKIAVIPGDGIGPEIVPAGIKVLNVAAKGFGFQLQYEKFPYGAGYYKQTGRFMPSDALEGLQAFDALYFGAVGLPDVDDTLPAKLFTFKVRTSFDQYVNYRPARLLPGIEGPLRKKDPKDIDFIVIRENTEGEFVQSGGFVRPEFAEGLAMDTSIFTRKGIERIARYSFELARKRQKHVTNVTKSNTLIHSLAYWDRIVEQVSNDYPDVQFDKMYVDNASANFVLHPERFDIIVTTNFIGDILSDLGGAIMGSLGLGPSGNINPEKKYPSMFEPIHGSAPDIAEQGIANPIGAIWSGAIMLEHLGLKKAADSIVRAIEMTVAQRVLPIDLGGSAKTGQITDTIVKNLESAMEDNVTSS